MPGVHVEGDDVARELEPWSQGLERVALGVDTVELALDESTYLAFVSLERAWSSVTKAFGSCSEFDTLFDAVVSPQTSTRLAPKADDVAKGLDQLYFLASELAKPDIFFASVSGIQQRFNALY